MITYSSEVSLNRPPGVVFPFVVEADKQALWSDVTMTPISGGPLRVGSRLEVAFGDGPFRVRIVLQFTRLEPDRLVGWTTSEGPVLWDGEYRLEPMGGSGTRLTQTGRMKFRGLWRLLEPIVGAEMRRGEIKELEKLKAVIEERAS